MCYTHKFSSIKINLFSLFPISHNPLFLILFSLFFFFIFPGFFFKISNFKIHKLRFLSLIEIPTSTPLSEHRCRSILPKPMRSRHQARKFVHVNIQSQPQLIFVFPSCVQEALAPMHVEQCQLISPFPSFVLVSFYTCAC